MPVPNTFAGNTTNLLSNLDANFSYLNTQITSVSSQFLSPTSYGAVGNNVTDDTAAFLSLEAANKGAQVNLLAKTYLVTSLPSNCRYFNGNFRVGTSTYPQPITPLSHPLDGGAVAIDENNKNHYWPGPVGQPSSGDVLIRTYTYGWRHNVSLSSPVMSELSYDGGLTWESPRIIYDDQTREPRGLVGGMITTSRYGVFFIIQDSSGTIQGTRFIYTDDSGTNWNTITIATTAFYPHGEYVFDDSGGVNVFGYGSGGTIYKARTTDNGATWTVTTAKAGAVPLTQLTEVSVVKIAASKYIMYARNDAGGDMYASTSTDLTTWSSWVDTNLALGVNPPLALVAWGKLWVYMCARRSTGISGWEDKLLVAELDADATYTAGGVVASGTPLRVCVANKTAMIGYLTVSQLRDGRYIGYMIDGETLTGSANPSTSRIVRLGGHPPVVTAPSILKVRRTQPTITHNPSFAHWTRATTFTGISGGTKIADRWFLSNISGATADISRVDTDDTVVKVLPNSPRYALNIQSAVGGSGRAIGQRFYARERIRPMLDRVVTMTCILRGTMPGYFYSRATLNFGSGGSATATTTANTSATAMSGDLTMLVATFYTPNADGATWGTNPYLAFDLVQNGAGSVNANIYGLWWDYGDHSIPLDPIDYDAERTVLDQYCRKLTFPATGLVGLARGNGGANTEIEVKFPTMMATPAFTGDSATYLQVNGTALNAISFDYISQQSARMIGTLSSGTLAGNAVGICNVTTGNTWSVLVDVGF